MFFLIVLMAFVTNGLRAEVNFTHTSADDFNQGFMNNVMNSSGSIILPTQATAMNSWVATTSLPNTLKDHEVCYWNNFVYLIGGFNGTTYSDAVYRANATTTIGSWTQLNSLPVEVRNHEVVVANGYIYVLGGRQDGVPFDTIYYAKLEEDGSIGDWQSSTTNLPQTLWGFTAEYIAGYIYLIGGSNLSTEDTAINNVYFAKVGPLGEIATFSATNNLPDNRNQHSMVVYSDYIYVIGGYNNSGTKTNTVFYSQINFDGTCTPWLAANTLPVSISGHSSTCFNDLVTIIGGDDGAISNLTYYTDINDSPTFTWNSGPHYPLYLTDAEAIGINDRVFCFGGYNDVVRGYIADCYYSDLTLSTDKVKDGIFVSEQFNFGNNRLINDISYTINNTVPLDYDIFYRTALEDQNWGSWQDHDMENPVTVSESKRYLQYMYWFHTNDVLSTLSLSDVTIEIGGHTEVSGSITGTNTWYLANSPYWVTADITLSSGSSLTIEPGVEVIFSPEAGFTIGQAQLYCVGTSTDSILFTSYDDEIGTWDGLYFDPNSDNGVSSTMEYTIIEKAGFGSRDANLYCNGTIAPNTSHSTFRYSDGRGIYLTTADVPFDQCYFENNANEGIFINSGTPTFVNCFSRNNDYGLHLPSPNINIPNGLDLNNNLVGAIALEGGTITSDKIWPYFNGDYVVLSNINVDLHGSKCRLTIEPGNTIKFEEGVRLIIGDAGDDGGELYAEGTPDSTITFTSANGNPAGWDGLYFHNASDYGGATSSLKNCIIENGNTYNIYLNSAHSVTIDSCLVRNSANKGVHVAGSYLTISNTELTGNSDYPIYFNTPNYLRDIFSLNIHDNTMDVLAVESGTITGDRTWNYCNGDYLMLGNINVDLHGSKCRLTIEPGNTIKFEENFGLIIGDNGDDGGELYAEGTPDNLITFTSANGNPGGWNGIIFYSASDYAGSTSYLKNCIIENGNNRNIYLNSTHSISIEDCVIRNSLNKGIHVISSYLTISDSEITGNGEYPIYYNAPVYIRELNNLNIHNNTLNYVASEAGTISADRRWKYCNAPYLFLGNLIVEKSNAACNLTIEPGCTLKFDNGVFRMGDSGNDGGELHAIGTTDSLITFTAANDSTGGWTGINFNPSSDYYSMISQLKNCVIEKGNTYNISFNSANNHIVDSCLVQYSAGNGIDVNSSTISLSNIQVENNAEYGLIYDKINLMQDDVSTFQFLGNGKNFIGLGGNVTGADNFIPYWQYGYSVLGDVTIETTNGVGAKLTIAPGNTLRFDVDCVLKIGDDYNDGGELYAVGTPDSIITFTSLNDSISGWDGIYFDDGSNTGGATSSIAYCTIENGSSYNVYSYATSQPAIDHTTIRNSGQYGLRCNNSNPQIQISQFINNNSYGIYLQGSSNPIIGNDPSLTCNLYGNGIYEVYNETSNNINCLHNFWNSSDSTFITTRIYDKVDEHARGYVYFHPFSTSSLFNNLPPEEFSLLTPANNVVVDIEHPSFTWEPAADPEAYTTQYEFMYTADSTWATYNIGIPTTNTTYTITDTLSGINHYWWKVAAKDEILTIYSKETWKFTVSLEPSIPDPILPLTSDYMTAEDHLVWLTSTDPDIGDEVSHYHLQIDDNNDFSSPEVDVTNIGLVRSTLISKKRKQVDYTKKYKDMSVLKNKNRDYAYAIQINEIAGYTNLNDNISYYWKVSAIDNYAIEGEFSDGSDNFIYFANGVEMSTVENITTIINGNSIELTWNPVTEDIYGNPTTISVYNIYRSEEPVFIPQIMQYIGNTSGISFTDTNVLNENKNYFYKITAVIGLNHFRGEENTKIKK